MAEAPSTEIRPCTLTVVLTVYNTEDCLAACLDDILAQTFSDYELVCVDDGSTDGSADLLKLYAPRFSAFTLIQQENAGPAAARNVGMDCARGTYLMLLDSDDRFEPTLFEQLMDAAQRTQSDIAACRSDEFDHGSGKRRPAPWAIREDLLPEGALEGRPFCASAAPACPFSAFMGWPWDKAYRTAFVREEGLAFPEQLPNAEDFPFVFLALCRARTVTVVDDALIHHRVKRSGSTSNSRLDAPMSFYEGIELLKQELERSDAAWKELRWGFLNWAVNYACWNIESLPAGSPQRRQLVEALLQGGMPALELDRHPAAYFSLHPDVDWCLRRLRKELRTGKPSRKSIWEYLWVACKRIAAIGPSALAKQAADLVRNR